MFLSIKLSRQNEHNDSAVPFNFEGSSSKDRYQAKSGNSEVSIQKRDVYPKTFLEIEGHLLKFGYGYEDPNDSRVEFLKGSFNSKTQTLTLERDAYCTLPLFYYLSDERCLVSDDLNWLVKQTGPVKLNKSALGQLLSSPFISDQTLFEGIKLLSFDTLLVWNDLEASVTRKINRSINVNESGNPKAFKKCLDSTLDAYWGKTQDQVSVFEVSGGIDSATMPLYISNKKQVINLTTMVFPGEFEKTQSKKLQDLLHFTSGDINQTEISLDDDFPLSRFFKNAFLPSAFYQYQEIYTEPLIKMAESLKNKGVTAVFTGIGGDELFENYPDTGMIESAPVSRLEYLTDHGNTELQIKQDNIVEGSIADSAYYAGQSRNKIYIDHGIWPLSPLTDPILRAYCQTLPVEFRDNKNILRAYHQASDFPSSIYYPMQNEHFGRFFDDSLKAHFETVIKTVSKCSVLTKYVDWQKAEQAFMNARFREDASADLFAIFRLTTAEIILKTASKNIS